MWTQILCHRQGNDKGLNIVLHTWTAGANNALDKKRKKIKIQSPLWSWRTKVGVLGVMPAHSTPSLWADLDFSPPTQCWTQPALTPFSGPDFPCVPLYPSPQPPRSKQGNLSLVWLPVALRAPIKPCLNFLSGLLSMSIDFGFQEPWWVTIVFYLREIFFFTIFVPLMEILVFFCTMMHYFHQLSFIAKALQSG